MKIQLKGKVIVLGGGNVAVDVARTALRVGAGVVTLAIPRSLNPVMEVKLTEVMTLPVDETPEGTLALTAKRRLRGFIKKADAVAIGPGLSQNDETVGLVKEILPQIGRPCVLDADGINAFEGDGAFMI